MHFCSNDYAVNNRPLKGLAIKWNNEFCLNFNSQFTSQVSRFVFETEFQIEKNEWTQNSNETTYWSFIGALLWVKLVWLQFSRALGLSGSPTPSSHWSSLHDNIRVPPLPSLNPFLCSWKVSAGHPRWTCRNQCFFLSVRHTT